MERWNKIEKYPEYDISDIGLVRDQNGNLRNLKVNDKGYIICCMKNGKRYKSIQIHRLVAIAFVPNPENKPQVDHINRDKTDNRAVNLRWVTQSENMKNMNYYKRIRKLKAGDVVKIKDLLRVGDKSQAEIGRISGVSYKHINNIARGIRHKNVA